MMLKTISLKTIEQFEKHLISDEKSKATIEKYIRDVKAGLNPKIPVNYFTNDDPSTTPHSTWQSHGFLLFSNWLNYYVYQNTPYNQIVKQQ